jgi:NADPH:quinone reductase-like Zn-dependent oxidoreductase
MKAVILKAFGGVEQLHLGDWPIAEPRAGEVRVRILAVAFNPADYKLRKGFGLEVPSPGV